MADPGTARVTLYSRAGCHLCDDARQVVERVCAELGESYAEVDVDADPDLVDRFGTACGIEPAEGASLRTRDRVVVESFRCLASCFRLTPPGAALSLPVFSFPLSGMR